MASYSILDMIAAFLSFLIIVWIMLKCQSKRKNKVPKTMRLIMLAFLFALFDIFIHEYGESNTLPFLETISSFAHLAMLLFSINALLVFNEEHKSKR